MWVETTSAAAPGWPIWTPTTAASREAWRSKDFVSLVARKENVRASSPRASCHKTDARSVKNSLANPVWGGGQPIGGFAPRPTACHFVQQTHHPRFARRGNR